MVYVLNGVCAIRFRSDPDKWARYFRVQRMITHLGRVEREAAEKRRQKTETADEYESHQPPSALLTVKKKSPRTGRRPASASSALKILVFGSNSGHSGTDPSPLLSSGQGTGLSLKPSRSASGRLDVRCGAGSTDSSPHGSAGGLCRTHSCCSSTGIDLQTGKLKLKDGPNSPSTNLQVSSV